MFISSSEQSYPIEIERGAYDLHAKHNRQSCPNWWDWLCQLNKGQLIMKGHFYVFDSSKN